MHNKTGLRFARKTDLGIYRQAAKFFLAVKIGLTNNVSNANVFSRFDINTTMQTSHPPLILIFDITHRAISHDDDRQNVLASHEKLADVIFAWQPTVGAITNELAIQIDGMHAFSTANTKHSLQLTPIIAHDKTTTIDTCGDSIRQVWW